MLRRLLDTLFVWMQYLLPAHFLSRVINRLTRWRIQWLKNLIARWFIARFRVNMDEAEHADIRAYPDFNSFFTRALKPGVRPLCEDSDALLCPVDGAVSQAMAVDGDSVFQAKGHRYSLRTLLGDHPHWSEIIHGGLSTTLYLSPRDYHRIHMPITGTLREVIHVPGNLFSVNRVTTHKVPGLFARNERVICVFDTVAGPMAMILVGAIFVASIETVWQGIITPPAGKRLRSWDYASENITLQAGEEMGRFNMGSTVILLFGKDRVTWAESLIEDSPVRVGEKLGRLC